MGASQSGAAGGGDTLRGHSCGISDEQFIRWALPWAPGPGSRPWGLLGRQAAGGGRAGPGRLRRMNEPAAGTPTAQTGGPNRGGLDATGRTSMQYQWVTVPELGTERLIGICP